MNVHIMDTRKNNGSKTLVKRIKRMMAKEKMSYKKAANRFGMRSPSTIHNWVHQEYIPKNWHVFTKLMLERDGY